MFGYITVNEPELRIREYHEYRSFYCGLCHELHRRYGRAAQMVLNYDLTFLALLLSALYEPQTDFTERRCIPHPVCPHLMAGNEAIGYAADMSVLLAYQKAKDDWEDEKNPGGRLLAVFLKKGYQKLAKTYPRQVRAIEESIAGLHRLEKEQAGMDRLDEVANLTGRFLAEVFVWKDDLWQEDLWQMGFYLGKFVYLTDALEDLKKDTKKGNYNPFSQAKDIWQSPQKETVLEILTSMMTEASKAFERLPIVSYAPILRNILYSGVWCKYALLCEQEEKE